MSIKSNERAHLTHLEVNEMKRHHLWCICRRRWKWRLHCNHTRATFGSDPGAYGAQTRADVICASCWHLSVESQRRRRLRAARTRVVCAHRGNCRAAFSGLKDALAGLWGTGDGERLPKENRPNWQAEPRTTWARNSPLPNPSKGCESFMLSDI